MDLNQVMMKPGLENASKPPRGEGKVAHGREYPIGAEVYEQGAHFRVWAPRANKVSVELSEDIEFSPGKTRPVDLEGEPEGYFSGWVDFAHPGMFYRYRLPHGTFPDPASRFQPQGPHGPSQLVSGKSFRWTDQNWRGVPRERQVIYELHIGTFTPQGTWAAAAEQLKELANLGITVLEIMPVAEFPGRFGWGYDGVDIFAPTRLYGRPDDFRSFVDVAHGLGLGVILDVVYNHLGPDGCYLKEFSSDYFSTEYQNEWGEALNFDGPNSGPVREFFITNAEYWIREFHLDGLRLDATQQIFDKSPRHLLAELSSKVREAAGSRTVYLVGENETQQARLAKPSRAGGYGLDALWNDDFHHSAHVALTGHSEAYYSDYEGSPQEFISACKRGFLYQGQWYAWQKKNRGSSTEGLLPEQFITFLENHDQVANSLSGRRMHQLSGPGRFRALTALLLLGPGTPMLFQGQEFGASAPFLFFADHNRELAQLVKKGRREFLSQFPSIAQEESQARLAAPEAEETFQRCKLNLAERELHAGVYALFRDLLKLRQEDPVFGHPRPGGLDGAVLGTEAFVLRFFDEHAGDRLVLVNLGADVRLRTMAEPLLAPAESREWNMVWSSSSPKYGGRGTPALERTGNWTLPGHTTLVLELTPKAAKPERK